MFGLREDECWSLVVQAKAETVLGQPERAAVSRESARQVSRAIGRSDDLVDRFLSDTGPDVR
jgi:hypothetical protein